MARHELSKYPAIPSFSQNATYQRLTCIIDYLFIVMKCHPTCATAELGLLLYYHPSMYVLRALDS